MQDTVEDDDRCGTAECLLSSGHFIQYRPEAEEVGARVQFLTARLLRRHVRHRADRCAGGRQVLGINRGRRRVLSRDPLTRPDTRGTLSPKGARAALSQKILP